MSNWTLLSNHGHVLVFLARDSEARLRDVAAAVGITERAVQKIVRDLQQSGMISVSKQGRRNQYRIHRKAGLRHELEADSNIGGLIDFVSGKTRPVAVVRKTIEPAAPVAVEPVVLKPKQVTGTVESVKQKEVADTDEGVKQKETADAGKTVKKEKVVKKAKEQSEIEKQQGSLF